MKRKISTIVLCLLVLLLPMQTVVVQGNSFGKVRDDLWNIRFSADYDASFNYADIMNTYNWQEFCFVLDRWSGDDFHDKGKLAYEFVMQQLYHSSSDGIFCLDAYNVDAVLRRNFNLDEDAIKMLHDNEFDAGYYYNNKYYVSQPEGALQGELYSVRVLARKDNLYKIKFVNNDFSSYGVNDPYGGDTYYCVFGVIKDAYGESFRIYEINEGYIYDWPENVYQNGDVIDEACYTDISANINGYDIASYNVNGYTYIIAEDLKQYGFDVTWEERTRTLSITKSGQNYITASYETPYVPQNLVGVKSYDILYTDIETYINNQWVPSYNINGRTIIRFDELKVFGAVSWDAVRRTISLYM